MFSSEFDVIEKYFKSSARRDDVVLGIGDDCAVLEVPDGKQLLSSSDTLIAGVHFPEDTDAGDIAAKALAVNLSDLAAMGAVPAWVSLAITLPEQDPLWLQEFSSALHAEISKQGLQLIGGDTTRGALSVTVQVMGFVDRGKAMLRSNAKAGDLVCVSGSLGDAALGLQIKQGEVSVAAEDAAYFLQRLNRPQARVELGLTLADICRCAIDISDGLFADLGHILKASGCGATIELDKLPLSQPMRRYLEEANDAINVYELMRGDDYELCFTVSGKLVSDIDEIAASLELPINCIGIIDEGSGLRCVDPAGNSIDTSHSGYDHFSHG